MLINHKFVYIAPQLNINMKTCIKCKQPMSKIFKYTCQKCRAKKDYIEWYKSNYPTKIK